MMMMNNKEIEDFRKDHPPRPCGECAACCTTLGVTALQKYSGQACKFLDGRDPCKRCAIYEKRPAPCMNYECAWKIGLFDDDDRPDKVGFVTTGYEESVVLLVFDMQKAGPPFGNNSPLSLAILELLHRKCDDFKVIFWPTKKMLWIHDGDIYGGIVVPQSSYEDLTYVVQHQFGTVEYLKENSQ